MLKVTVWHESPKEAEDQAVLDVYPEGMLEAIAGIFSGEKNISIRRSHLEMDNCGISQELLDNTDVLIWWGHSKHHLVSDEAVKMVHRAVLKGMGFIALHSAHFAKPFISLMGTSCSLRWRDNEYERIWCVQPGHPIAQGVPSCFDLEEEEMYGEFFDIPEPESLVFIGWFRGGEVFRSGCCWTRGLGKVFYFQPGHETNRAYFNPHIKQILINAVNWAAPVNRRTVISPAWQEPAEKMVKEGRIKELQDKLGWE